MMTQMMNLKKNVINQANEKMMGRIHAHKIIYILRLG